MPRARTLVLVVRYCGFVCPFDAFFCKIVPGQFLVIFVYTCKTRVYLFIKVASRQGNFLYEMYIEVCLGYGCVLSWPCGSTLFVGCGR